MSSKSAIDFIGDIHGHCDELRALLKKLGYVETAGTFRYPRDERIVVFLGDYVDRGPQIRETLNLVRAMRDSGSAIALMGNHEFNMLSFWYKNGDGGRFLKNPGRGYLRKHTLNQIKGHLKTIETFAGHEDEFEEVKDFAKTLPFYLATDTFCAQHASFDPAAISALKNAGISCFADGNFDELIYRANDEDCEYTDSLFRPIDLLLKGPEMKLPDGVSFIDKDGKMRTSARIRWWVDPTRADLTELSMEPLDEKYKSSAVPDEVRRRYFHGEDERPVFFGHYWLKGEPQLLRRNVCCLDYSVAAGGCLACYRFDGEQQLDATKLVWVKQSTKVSLM